MKLTFFVDYKKTIKCLVVARKGMVYHFMVPEFDESENEEACQLVELAIKSESAVVVVVEGAVSQ